MPIRRKGAPAMLRAALYIRVSTKYQVDKDSLPFQAKKLKEYLSFLGIQDFDLYEDDGYSAKNTKRPEYQRMMDAIRRGKYSHLLVYKLDRISRNLLDFAAMYEELKEQDVTFVSLNEQFDTSTAIGEAMLKIILIFAELERKMTGERVTGIMLNRAETGLWNGGHVPFGYRMPRDISEGIFPVPDEESGAAGVVRKIFDLYEQMKSGLQVARWLHNNGIRGKNGGKWTSKMIHDVIRSPFYIGTYRYNVRKPSRGKMKPESEWIVRENNHIGIIQRGQFIRCNAIMDKNAERNTSDHRKNEYVHTFSGLLRCASCGSGFMAGKDRIRSNGFRPSVYRCTKRSHTMDCNARTISELTLGPFVFQYAANMVRAQKNFSRIQNIQQLQTELLKGKEFEHITGIEAEGLELMWSVLSGGNPSGRYQPSIPEHDAADPGEMEMLIEEKAKQEKASERLMQLYLFDPESMPASEVSRRKKEIQERIRQIDDRIREIGVPCEEESADMDFIRKASALLIAKNIEAGDTDYLKLANMVDTEILKEFINQIVEYVEIDQGRISAICFKNGLVHRFQYLGNLGEICQLCGGQMHTTVGCRKFTLDLEGKKHKRIRAGKEKCPGCGADPERCHHYGCPEEICPICKISLSKCKHKNYI